MCCYDTFIDKKGTIVQCKALKHHENMNVYRIGYIIPDANYKNMTICLPSHESKKFIVIVNGVFIRLTNVFKLTIAPYISKWNDKLTEEEAKVFYDSHI